MGCDIHLHTEVKINGGWYHYSCPNVPRNYRMFEKMAGVRGDVAEAIVAPKGLPESSTFLTRLSHGLMDLDAHTASWLSWDEIKELYEWLKPYTWQNYPDDFFGRCFGNGWNYDHEDSGVDIEDLRFVFWFDN